MGCQIIKRVSVIAVIAMLGVGLSTSAQALFTGIDDEQDSAKTSTSAGGDTALGAGTAAATGSSPAARRAVDPFADTAGVTLPDDTPEAVVNRSQAWYNRPTNSRRFEHLLNRAAPADAPSATTKPKELAAPAKTGGSHTLDYIVGFIVVAGLGATILLLFRRHH